MFLKTAHMTLLLALTFSLFNGCANFNQNANDTKIARVYIKLAYGYIEQNNLARAKQKLTKALGLAPNLPETQDAMAYLYTRLGENKEAERYYQKAVLLSKEAPQILNNYGAFLCKIGRFNEAEQCFLKVIANPLYERPQDVYENAGLCALMCAKTTQNPSCSQKADIFFKKALSYHPMR